MTQNKSAARSRVRIAAGWLALSLPLVAGAQGVATPFDYTRTSKFTYYGAADGALNGLLKSETLEPGTPDQCVQTTYGYDGWGNKTTTTSANCAGAAGDALFTSRTTTQTFSRGTQPVVTLPIGKTLTLQTGQFPLDGKNALNHPSSQLFDPRFGTPIQFSDANGKLTKAEFDELGRKVKETKPDGTSTNWRHCVLPSKGLDTSSNSSGCVAPAEAPGDAAFYVQSWPTDKADVVSGPWSMVFTDRVGRQLRSVTQSFNGPSQPAAQSGKSVVQDIVYDAYGTKVLSSQPYWLSNGSSTTGGANNAGATKVVVDALGRPKQIYTVETKGTRTGVVFGAATFAGYGAYGTRTASLVEITYAGSKTTTKTYYKDTDSGAEKSRQRIEEKNPAGELVRVTDNTGAQVVQQPDAFGVLRYTKDALGNTITVISDVRGRKLELQDADTGKIVYGYNALGELVRQSNPKQRAKSPATSTQMTYDVLGRLTKRIDDEYTSNWYYDKDVANASCRSSGTSYGHLCETKTSHDVRRRYWFDDLGRPTSERLDVVGGISAAQRLEWDANTSRLLKRTWPSGLAVSYDYTTLGFVSQMRLSQSATINPLPATPGGTPGQQANWAASKVIWRAEIANAWGRSERHSTGESADTTAVTTRSTFDGTNGRVLNRYAGLSAGASLFSQSYGYDTLGHLNARTDGNGTGDGTDVSETFTYDSLDRLVNYTAAHPGITGGQREVDLTYNAVGQLLKRSDIGAYSYTVVAGQTSPQPHSIKKFTDLTGKVTKYSYDVDGNMTTALYDGSTCAGRKYCWVAYNSFNQPDSDLGIRGPVTGGAGSPRYTWQYDQDHARIKETRLISGTAPEAGTRTTWRVHPDNQGGLGFEFEDDAPKVPSQAYPQTQQSRHYVSAGGQVVAVFVSEGAMPTLAAADKVPPAKSAVTLRKVEYWHTDPQGSLIATSSHAGALTQRYSYDPFGQRRFTSGADDSNQTLEYDWDPAINKNTGNGYTGHEHLDDVGVIHMNGRMFDPKLGLFIQPDPMLQDPFNLQNYNRYGYCYNSPMGCTDMSGLCFMGCFWQPKVATKMTFDFIHRLPGQAAVDRYIMTHQWANALGQTAATYFTAFCGGCGGYAWSAYYTYQATGSVDAAAKAAAIAYVTNAAFSAVGTATGGHHVGTDYFMTSKHLANMAGHALVGCASAAASGGDCKSQAMAAAFQSFGAPYAPSGGAQGMAYSMVIGGTASVLGGGKFANGAQTAAMGYMFNHMGMFGIEFRPPAWIGKVIFGPEYIGQGGSVGVAFSWPGDANGEFDFGLYGTVNGSGIDIGTGKAALGMEYGVGSLRQDLAGRGAEVSFNDGLGGMSLSFDQDFSRLTGVGLHVGPGYNVGASVQMTGVLSLRNGFDWLFDKIGSTREKR